MAATEARRRRRRLHRDLPILAAGVGALAAREARGQSFVDSRFLFYKESDGRTQVLNPMALVHQDLGNLGALDLTLAYDSISGASPTGGYPTMDVTTSASGNTSSSGKVPLTAYHDHRESIALGYGRKLGAHLPSIDVSYAKENDYTARNFGLSDAWTMAHGRGTLHYGVSFASDIVAPVTNSLELPKKEQGYALGWSWILGERDLIDVSGSLMKLTGYLDDPYKIVPIGEPGTTVTMPDHRPDSRSRKAALVKYGHYFPWDGALKLTYRYYWDDWGVKAHTLDAVYDQKLDESWVLTPRVRLYTQGAASFYSSLLAGPTTFASADYRLSSFWSALGGLAVSRKLDDRTAMSLGATVQQQVGRDQLVPFGSGGERGPTVSAADMTVFTVTAGFTFGY